MHSIKYAAIIAMALTVGCDKNQPASPATATPGAVAPSSATPAVVTPASIAAMSSLAGTYNAVSDVDGQPGARRHQLLTLGSDGTAMLTTTITKAANTKPESSDMATGTYTAEPKEVVVTFAMKDGKAIPATDTMHVMKMSRGAGDKALSDSDGRTFERAK